jgi:hypothetical protein
MSVYKLMAKFNPEGAVLRLLNDRPDGLNVSSVKKEICLSLLNTRKLLNRMYEENKLNKTEIGASKVFYIG